MAELKPANSAAQAAHAPIIIKRVKKSAEAHHGGSWKVAYADFVTAMMAFFLLLWLLNATTEEQKLGISNYFAPESPSRTTSGAGGPFGGLSLTTDGPLATPSSPTGLVVQIPRPPPRDEEPADDEDGTLEPQPPAPDQVADDAQLSAEELARLEAEREERRLIQAEEALRQAITETPELKAFANNLVVDRSPEGLRIQIVDQSQVSMFPRGSSAMYDHTRRLLAQVTKVIGGLPNRIAITGHTDATKYANPDGYSNWELSADRANASRRALVEMGLPAERIALVMGKADREPLIGDNPEDPRNRRIGIVVLYDAAKPVAQTAAAEGKRGAARRR